MNRTSKVLVVMVVISLLLSSCDMDLNKENSILVTEYTPKQIADVIISAQDNISVLQPLFMTDEDFNKYVLSTYNLEAGEIFRDGVIYYPTGMLADEIAIFLLNKNADSDDIKNALVTYKKNRANAFAGYAPEQSAILESGIVVIYGDYVALLLCENPKNAESVFLQCFSNNPPKINDMAMESSTDIDEKFNNTNENTTLGEPIIVGESIYEGNSYENIFDSNTVLEAWRSGDKTGLQGKNRSVFDACKEIIETIITGDMSDYEKELAIHDWIIDWADYDQEVNSNSPNAKPDPDNVNPFGVIFRKKAVCTGYTATFQLFMDLLGIECISIKGESSGGEHNWNMVRLDGEWYCVDVTWDDPSGGHQTAAAKHKYFNVTTKFMRETGHKWDESTTPVADAGKYYID